ncbi:Amino-acid acetyltransferase mitochondrial, partial [Bienertia sinuspersici]
MAIPSRGWTSTRISTIASRCFFFLIFLQIPLFRVPCTSGMCTTPMHVTSSQLIASDIIPVVAVKTLLYPGAMVHGLVKDMSIPSWNNLVDSYNLTSVKDAPVTLDLKRLEVQAYELQFYYLLLNMQRDLLK